MSSRRWRAWNLVALILAVVALAALLEGRWLWFVAGLLMAATAFGTLQLLGEGEARGVPIESLMTPAVAAIAVLGIIPVLDELRLPNPLIALGVTLVVGAPLLKGTLDVEGRLLGEPETVAPGDRTRLELLILLIALLAFSGIAATIRGGLAETGAATRLEPGRLALLAVADGTVAFILGYRLSALRVPVAIEAVWAAGTYATVIGLAAALMRELAVPRLVGPALLTLVFYLWSAYRGSSRAQRRDVRWLWEYAALVVAALAVIVYYGLVR